MNRIAKQSIFFAVILILTLACTLAQPTPSSQEVMDQVGTSVAMTVTAMSIIPTSTETPLPTPTEPASPTPTFTFPTLASTVIIPTAQPDYACDIINQRPYDDTKFRRNEAFDVRWTLVNTGRLRWVSGTYVEYQDGPKMTEARKVYLPNLKPGEKFDVILDAVAPDETDRKVMVWAVIGPGKVKGSIYWMCYPYIRIIVGR